VITEKS